MKRKKKLKVIWYQGHFYFIDAINAPVIGDYVYQITPPTYITLLKSNEFIEISYKKIIATNNIQINYLGVPLIPLKWIINNINNIPEYVYVRMTTDNWETYGELRDPRDDVPEKYYLKLIDNTNEVIIVDDNQTTNDKKVLCEIPSDATNLEVFAIKNNKTNGSEAFIGFKIANGNFHFISVPFTEPIDNVKLLEDANIFIENFQKREYKSPITDFQLSQLLVKFYLEQRNK